ncbi:MAG: M56 family metallopeptidase [Maricaulaceae bacterium]|jgi:beta-lactamase regulating signal transducer with metallopeptidase domain
MMIADILSALLSFNIALGAGVLVVVALRVPARRLFGARLAYMLWLVPLAAGVAALLPARPVAALSPIAPASARQIADAAIRTLTDIPSATTPAPRTSSAGSTASSGANDAADEQTAQPHPAQLKVSPIALGVLWTVGAGVGLILLARRQRRALARFGRLTPIEHGLACAQNSDAGPAVVGVFRPTLVLPADFEARYSARERALVLAHEDAHLIAQHTRINALVAVGAALNWFNPLVYVAARLSRIDQELACDATVAEQYPNERRAYAEALLKSQLGSAPPLGCAWPPRSSRALKARIAMLANALPGRARRLAGAVCIAVLGAGAGFAAWSTEPATTVVGPLAPGLDPSRRVVIPGGMVIAEADEQPEIDWDAYLSAANRLASQLSAEAAAADSNDEAQEPEDCGAPVIGLVDRATADCLLERRFNGDRELFSVTFRASPLSLRFNEDLVGASEPAAALSNVSVVCDAWETRYAGAFEGWDAFDWEDFDNTAQVLLSVDEAGEASVTIPDPFPAGAFPDDLEPRGVFAQPGEDSLSYRVVATDFVDQLTFFDIDEAAPRLHWLRIHFAETDAHQIFLNATCRRL